MSRRWIVGAGLATVMVAAAACGIGGSPAAPSPAATRPALPAGDYRSSVFRPPTTVTLPGGWVIAGDAAGQFSLQPAQSEVVGIHLFRSPVAASQELDCPIAPAPGVGAAAADLVEWISARPGLEVSQPVPVSIGGLAGQRIDLRIKDGWTASCPFAEGLPTVPLFVSAADPGFRWVVAGGERLRLNVLDVPGEGTVVVDIDDFDGTFFDQLLTDATPIVESMRFGLS